MILLFDAAAAACSSSSSLFYCNNNECTNAKSHEDRFVNGLYVRLSLAVYRRAYEM